ncbi:LytR/AlgR family response regulator transcription factor [Spirosoma montaniterrae]|uniref:LytTR family transcriptional regulator n=1 Tax=Spirosoma montaniterrae TaxID=1178516 RepID=A0A1P9WTK4_9BACT|nr:LytTR family DNA-binding domain-containing protein [Spirosoma montaniterrae]AQG78715.1 LytTR family transcriptional regulator [Spirosoma montaniterrae]
MTILLIEDEPLVGKQLLKLMRQLEPDATLAGPLTSVQDVVDYLTNNRPDLVIADIQLADGVSFDAFGTVGLNVPVIFTTAYDEYAIRAFKLNSIDYLLKPIDPDELRAALAKYHRWQPTGTDFAEQFQMFLAQFTGRSATPAYKRRFTAHYLRQIISVSQEQIACFCRDELIFLHTTDGQKLITDYRTLDELDELLDPARFFRANRQYIIALESVAGYEPHYSGKLIVHLKKPNDSLDITISKEKAGAFRQWFEG